MISEISPIVNFVTILKTAWCVISCIGFTEIQRSRNMSKYTSCFASTPTGETLLCLKQITLKYPNLFSLSALILYFVNSQLYKSSKITAITTTQIY